MVLVFILGLALVRGVIYASFVPPWQAPDEPAQFERTRAALSAVEWNSVSENGPVWYAELIGTLCTFDIWDFLPGPRRETCPPQALLNEYIAPYQEVYAGLYGSRLTYAIMGWPLFLARHLDISLQLYLARLNTVLMNVGIIFFAYLTTRTIFPDDDSLSLGVPILILFTPQHSHLLATINNGNIAELLAVVALYAMVHAIIKGYSWLKVLAICIFTLVAIWTKPTAYFLISAIGLMGLFYLWRFRRYWFGLLPAAILLGGLIYLFAPGRLKQILDLAWWSLQADDVGLDPLVPLVQFRSFWATPGWLTLYLHPFWYQALAISCSMALVGLIILLIRRWRLLFAAQDQPTVQALIVLGVATGVALAVIWGWSALTQTVAYRQGRSLYPVIVPISIFLLLGWRELIPAHWRDLGLLTLTIAMFLFDSLVLFNYIVPFFYSRY